MGLLQRRHDRTAGNEEISGSIRPLTKEAAMILWINADCTVAERTMHCTYAHNEPSFLGLTAIFDLPNHLAAYVRSLSSLVINTLSVIVAL